MKPFAKTGEVCGWLIPLRNWFNSHVGANLDMPEPRTALWSRARLSVDILLLCERPERPERIEA